MNPFHKLCNNQDALLFFSGKAVPTGILCQKVEILGFSYRCFDQCPLPGYQDFLFFSRYLYLFSPRIANELLDYIVSNNCNLFQCLGIKTV